MSLLPSRPDAEPAEDAGPRVVGLEDEDADDVLAALSSGTARSLLSALHDDPAPPSELADRCDTSLQNVQYHLEKLENAGAIEVVDTAYSSKGREMDVYAPADEPLVVFAGDEADGSTLRTALTRLLGAVGVLALASLLIEALLGRGGRFVFAPTVGDGAGGSQGGADGDRSYQGEDGGGGGQDVPDSAPTGGGGDGAAPATETAAGADGSGTPMATESAEPTAVADTPTPDGPALDTPAPETTHAPEETVTEHATEVARDSATELARTATESAGPGVDPAGSGLPPGLLFFAGGLFVLAVLALVWYVGQR